MNKVSAMVLTRCVSEARHPGRRHIPPWYHEALPHAARVLFMVAIGVTSGACQKDRWEAFYPGSSTGPHPHSTTKTIVEQPPRKRWDYFERSKSWAITSRFRSTGHYHGAYEAEVRIPLRFAKAYSEVPYQKDLPDGLTAAMFHYAPGTAQLTGVLVLSLKHQRWSALILDASGYVLEPRETLCLRCHADAPADTLFGLPASKRGMWVSPPALAQKAAPAAEPTSP